MNTTIVIGAALRGRSVSRQTARHRSVGLLVALAGCLLAGPPALHAAPVISDVTAFQRPSIDAFPKYVNIRYTISDPDATSVNVSLLVSQDSGATWTVPAHTFAAGYGVGIGVNVPVTATPEIKTFSWDAGTDWDGHFTTRCRVRVVVNDSDLVLIPAGSYLRGDSLDAESDAPVYSVYVNAFLMDVNLVKGGKWNLVKEDYADKNGYAFANAGSYKAVDHPVQTVNWYDAVKWCNARSEMEGLTPVYYSYGTPYGPVYKTGEGGVAMKPDANGYRLPTEAEWEKAARGGLSGKRYPWGDSIDHSQANYDGDTTWDVDPMPYTSPVGSFPANGYGLYDMAGNVLEWCFDWYGPSYYASGQTDPQGPISGEFRVFRGGRWQGASSGIEERCAVRASNLPDRNQFDCGFRCVRGR